MEVMSFLVVRRCAAREEVARGARGRRGNVVAVPSTSSSEGFSDSSEFFFLAEGGAEGRGARGASRLATCVFAYVLYVSARKHPRAVILRRTNARASVL